jgi:uncharacterized membrane protein YedE/YeeE
MKTPLIALFIGVLFGAGLALSGMTDPNKVIGFLDLLGDWDITLMFVMTGGLMITVPTFQWLSKRFTQPVCGDAFNLPTRTDLDKNLVLGAILFGCGWGLAGICPGPAIASLAYFDLDIVIFVASLSVGMFIAHKVQSFMP